MASTLDEEKTYQIVCKKIAPHEEGEVTLLESEVAATAKAFILHKYGRNQNDHKNILLFHENGAEVAEYSPVQKNQTYWFGFVDKISKWVEENPEIHNILKKSELDDKSFVVCSLAMMDFKKETIMLLVKENEMNNFLVYLGLKVLFPSVLVLKQNLEEFAKI